MDVPQQMGPAPLLQARVVVIGGVEITDQHPAEGGVQHFIHHPFIPTPTQEVSFPGGAESPNIAVGSVLAPAGFVGLHHRTGADLFQYRSHRRLGLPGHSLNGLDDGSHAQIQLVDRLEIPLNGPQGQASLFPQGNHQAHQVDPQALLARNHPRRASLGSRRRSHAGQMRATQDMLGHFYRNRRQLNDFSSSMYPAAVQVGPAVGTEFHGMLHPPGRSHAFTGEAVAPGLSGLLFLRWLLAGGGLIARHPRRPTVIQPGF